MLLISGIQHFVFCKRQWALIHLEQQWAENVYTAEGDIFHKTSHDAERTEKRGDLLITRGMQVASHRLGITGKCDVVEFRRDPEGIALYGWEGKWRPYPVEYKRGRPKAHNADALQLAAQAVCLEEMLACTIAEGCLFYGETHRREPVPLTDALRGELTDTLEEMRALFKRGHTPRVKPSKACKQCSLKEQCLPGQPAQSVSAYIQARLKEE